MEIRLKQPSLVQADWAVSEDGTELVITPRFSRRSSTQVIANVEFCNANGVVIPGQLVVVATEEPKLGFRSFHRDKVSTCPFDDVKPNGQDKVISAADSFEAPRRER